MHNFAEHNASLTMEEELETRRRHSGTKLHFKKGNLNKQTCEEQTALPAVSIGMQSSHPIFLLHRVSIPGLNAAVDASSLVPAAGIVFSVCTEPYLQSEYGSDYMSDSPVKLLEKTLHGKRQTPDEEVTIRV